VGVEQPGADERRVDLGDSLGAEVADLVQPLIQIQGDHVANRLRVGPRFPDAMEDPR